VLILSDIDGNKMKQGQFLWLWSNVRKLLVL